MADEPKTQKNDPASSQSNSESGPPADAADDGLRLPPGFEEFADRIRPVAARPGRTHVLFGAGVRRIDEPDHEARTDERTDGASP